MDEQMYSTQGRYSACQAVPTAHMQHCSCIVMPVCQCTADHALIITHRVSTGGTVIRFVRLSIRRIVSTLSFESSLTFDHDLLHVYGS